MGWKTRKNKGISYERELVKMFWDNGWAALRVAGSGSSRFPSPDVLAGNKIRRVAVECKSRTSNVLYIAKHDMEELIKFATTFGAEPWIGVRFKKENWVFITPEDMDEKNNSFSVNLELAKTKGLLFEELIES